jgi:iron complex outermembrane recepter protein
MKSTGALRKLNTVTWLAVFGLLFAMGFPGHGVAQDVPPASRFIIGTVTDAETGDPVVGVRIRIADRGQSDLSHADGGFELGPLGPGIYTLVFERIGYATTRREVEVVEGRVTRVEVSLRPSAISLAGIVVTGVGRERAAAETYRPTIVLSGEELQRKLSNSLAATLAHEPGISMQSFGPAPAQPVIRGLAGDRVLVLEDGQRTGDLSSTAPDHAVGIDPVTAERVEVVRGPAGLLYGSNALGGVVNVIRDEVPRSVPDGLHGSMTLQGESVNRGGSAGAVLRSPVGERFAVRGELSGRAGGDTRTPAGVLQPTDVQGLTVGAGLSWIPSWGHVGVAYRNYRLNHGLPGEFEGQEIPGAHEGGAEANTSRQAGRFELRYRNGNGLFEIVELDGNLVHYIHDELEPTDDGGQVLGARFDQLMGSGTLTARHEHNGDALRVEGALGVYGQYRDLITTGSFPGSRSATERSLAVFGFEELAVRDVRFQLGLRYDWTEVEPHDASDIRLGERRIPVRERSFGDLSGSVALLWEVRPGWVVGTSVARAFRTPSIRELYSDGPHLADFSYDVGNPELGSETGLGTDLFLRVSQPGIEFEVSAFRNALDGYIYHAPTGEVDPRFRRFPVFEARGDDAVFQGADGRIQWEALQHLVLDATVSYVRATRTGELRDPLPAIPPLHGSIRTRWERSSYYLDLGFQGAASQDRVPRPIPSPSGSGEFLVPEEPTSGYGLVNLGGGFRWTEGDRLHSMGVRLENVLDREWRHHLSRIKSVAPEQGRNLQLLYRVSF